MMLRRCGYTSYYPEEPQVADLCTKIRLREEVSVHLRASTRKTGTNCVEDIRWRARVCIRKFSVLGNNNLRVSRKKLFTFTTSRKSVGTVKPYAGGGEEKEDGSKLMENKISYLFENREHVLYYYYYNTVRTSRNTRVIAYSIGVR